MKMPGNLSWGIVLTVVVSHILPLTAAAKADVGPKAVSTDQNGVTTWTVGSTTIPVREFGALQPTIVYNCAYMPAICKTVNRYLSYLPEKGNERLFHMDTNGPRKMARRDVSCPTSWIKAPDADGKIPRCPESDQPPWTGYVNGDTTPRGPYQAVLSGNPPNPKKPDEPNYNRLGNPIVKFTQDPDTQVWKAEKVWKDLPGIFTCDEFPAASWIEGGGIGSDGDGHTVAAASTYCAPFRSSCNKGGEVWTTDQNWQGDAHNRLGNWGNYLWSLGTKKGSLTVFSFKLRTINDASSKYAAWVEANGEIRLCLGPGLSSGGKDCWKELTDDELKMVSW